MNNPDPNEERDDLDLIGKTINGYQIIEQVGKGGMAHVYKAYQPSLDRNVALKVLPSYYIQQDQTFMARFQREAKAIAKLRHPNILLVIDYGEFEDIAFIVMEYVPAGTLKDRMQKTLSLTEIHSLIGQVGKALDYAHKEGIIHRDIKPSNVLMPEPDWALLTDFGLARMVIGDNTNLTQSGMAVGTPAYMAPEQGQGLDIDHRADIYSLGVILYEMVVGEAPYSAETPMAVLVKHIVDPLPIISTANPDIPDDVQRIVLKSLAKDPEDRYQSAAELVQALGTIKDKYGDWLAPTVAVPSADPAETFELPDHDNAPTLVPEPTQEPEQKKPAFSWPFLGGFAGAMTALAVLAVIAIVSGFVAVNVFRNRADNMQAQAASETAEMIAFLATDTPTKTPKPSPTALPTETPPPPPTSVPTNTPVPSPTIPIPVSGDVLHTDDFSNAQSGWDNFGDPDFISDYYEDEYRIRMLNTEYGYLAIASQYFDAVSVEVDAYLAEGSEKNGYGVICSFRDYDNFFMATISSKGLHDFWEVKADEFIWLGGDYENPHPAILGGNAVNHIRVECVDNTISLYVNHEFIGQVEANLHSGDVGFWAEGFADGPIEIRFDNLKVTQP